MSEEKQFAKGLIVKKNPSAPDFVICNLSIKKDEFIQWLQTQQTEWVNISCKTSKGGKHYADLDTWKPDPNKTQEDKGQQVNNNDNSDLNEVPF